MRHEHLIVVLLLPPGGHRCRLAERSQAPCPSVPTELRSNQPPTHFIPMSNIRTSLLPRSVIVLSDCSPAVFSFEGMEGWINLLLRKSTRIFSQYGTDTVTQIIYRTLYQLRSHNIRAVASAPLVRYTVFDEYGCH
jgi:hypothetical protein